MSPSSFSSTLTPAFVIVCVAASITHACPLLARLIVTAPVSDGGAGSEGSIVVNGAGNRVTLAGANTYLGSTTVNGAAA